MLKVCYSLRPFALSILQNRRSRRNRSGGDQSRSVDCCRRIAVLRDMEGAVELSCSVLRRDLGSTGQRTIRSFETPIRFVILVRQTEANEWLLHVLSASTYRVEL